MAHDTTIHYNNEVKFFQSFLDPYLKYTSGLFLSDNDTLDKAITNMLDKIIFEANLKENSSILEIGSGWGSLLRRVRESFSDVSYVGLSPSVVQNEFIRKQNYGNCEIIDTSFEEWQPSEKKFDVVILVGSYCHLRGKQEQLSRITEMLNPKGRVIIEDTCFLNEKLYQAHRDHPATQFVQKKVFGYAEIPTLSWQVEAISLAGLQLISLLEHSDSYKKTIAFWLEKLEKMNKDEYPLVESFIQYMTIGQKGLRKTNANYLFVAEKY